MQVTRNSTFPHLSIALRSMDDLKNRGLFVENKLRQLGITKKSIADKLNTTRQSIDNWLNKADLEFEKIALIGAAARYDFSSDFPEMAMVSSAMLLNEPDLPYETKIGKCMQELERWKAEAYRQAEELLKAKNKIIELLEENSLLKNQNST